MALVKALLLAAGVGAAGVGAVPSSPLATDDKHRTLVPFPNTPVLRTTSTTTASASGVTWNTWALVGSVVAGACALALIILISVFVLRRRLKRRKQQRRRSELSAAAMRGQGNDKARVNGNGQAGDSSARSVTSTRSSDSNASEASTAMPGDFRGTPPGKNSQLPTIYQAGEFGVPSRYSFGEPDTVTNRRYSVPSDMTQYASQRGTTPSITMTASPSSSTYTMERLRSGTSTATPPRSHGIPSALKPLNIPDNSPLDPHFPHPANHQSQVSPSFCVQPIPPPRTPPRSADTKSAVTPSSVFTRVQAQHGRDDSLSSTSASSLSMSLSMIPVPIMVHPSGLPVSSSVSSLQSRSPSPSLSMGRSLSMKRKSPPPALVPPSAQQFPIPKLEPEQAVSPLLPLNFPNVPPRTLRTSLTKPHASTPMPTPIATPIPIVPDSPMSARSIISVSSTEESSASVYASASPSPTPSMTRLSGLFEAAAVTQGFAQGVQNMYTTATPTTSFPAHTVEQLQDD